MVKLSANVTDEALLKTYRIGSLNPTKWEDVDHEASDSAAGAIMGDGSNTDVDAFDALGLGAPIDTSRMSVAA
ncbi:hypothetical protein FRC17_007689, partial [Serendipita sp. 399]